jgi:hypothetical protein
MADGPLGFDHVGRLFDDGFQASAEFAPIRTASSVSVVSTAHRSHAWVHT